MNIEAGQWTTFLGCDLVNEALSTIEKEWEQHIASIHHSIVDLYHRDLRHSETPAHLATPSGKRKKRYTSAQKAIQALLNSASSSSLNSSVSTLESVKRVTRAQAKKCLTDTSLNGSVEKQSTGSSSSVNETKGKRKGRPKLKKDDVFVKPLEPVSKSDSESISVKKEKDETDYKSSIDDDMPLQVSPIPKPSSPEMEDEEDPSMWNVKRTENTSQTKKEKIQPVSSDAVIENVKKMISPDQVPQDSEWSTEDESFESVKSIGDETYARMTKKKSLNTSGKLSTVKKKRKQTEYFTPSIPRKSSRLTSRASKLETTPKTETLVKNNRLSKTTSATKCSRKVLCEKSSGATTSGSSIASTATTITSLGRSDSVKGKTAMPRTCTTPDTKTLTASALKRRLAEEEKRKAQLALMKEKEEKALQQKQENLKLKALSSKLKNEERRKRIESIRKKEEEELKEKRQKELSRQEELEKRRREKEEARRREAIKNQEALRKKKEEFELRKQQEEEERKARQLKQEEQIKKKAEENERIKEEQEKILQMINAHNKNIQKKVPATSASQKSDQPNAQFKQPLPPVAPVLPMNSTFSVDKGAEPELISIKVEKTVPEEEYQITPPPKPKPTPVNYDISDIKSDDDTDDEERPRKQIPQWAKGDALIAALDAQFAKSRRAREREIRSIFPKFQQAIELSDIFKSTRVVHPKYDKRTSSAVWSSPPCNSTLNCSVLTDDL